MDERFVSIRRYFSFIYLWEDVGIYGVELLVRCAKNIKLSKAYIPFQTIPHSSDIHTILPPPECLLKILLGHLPVQNIFYLVNDFLLLTSTCCTSNSLPCFFFFFFTCVPLIINALIAIRESRNDVRAKHSSP